MIFWASWGLFCSLLPWQPVGRTARKLLLADPLAWPVLCLFPVPVTLEQCCPGVFSSSSLFHLKICQQFSFSEVDAQVTLWNGQIDLQPNRLWDKWCYFLFRGVTNTVLACELMCREYLAWIVLRKLESRLQNRLSTGCWGLLHKWPWLQTAVSTDSSVLTPPAQG